MITGALPLRVTVLDTWDTVELSLPTSTPISEVKQQALTKAGVARPADAYLVKYLGAEVPEAATLATAGVAANGALIVLSRRRRPVR